MTDTLIRLTHCSVCKLHVVCWFDPPVCVSQKCKDEARARWLREQYQRGAQERRANQRMDGAA